MSVPRKFTKSLLIKRRLSNQAPRKLSKNIPRMAESTQIGSQRRGSNPPRMQTKITNPAAIAPAMVPARLTAPSVPGVTGLQVVTRRAVFPNACPTSLEVVSAAASESAAAIASKNAGRLWPSSEDCRASSRHPQVCQDLRTLSSIAAFGRTEHLLTLVPQSGREPGQGEDRDQRHESAQPPALIEHKAADGPRNRPRRRDSSDPVGKEGKRYGEQTSEGPAKSTG